MATFADHDSLGQALADYFRAYHLGDDGGYARRWVRINLGLVPVWFPNTASRRAALLQHDLHHVATGYESGLRGEAEIGAWELASGCRQYYVAWILNLGAVAMGLFIAPRRVFRAFRLGRRCHNLYELGIGPHWGDETVGALRCRLGLEGLSR